MARVPAPRTTQGAQTLPQGRALLLLESLRPRQWSKNLLVFAGLVFAGRLLDPQAVVAASAAFVIFCALSGVVYLINDVLDRESDREHPLKQHRPIASGAVSIPLALGTAATLAALALTGSLWLGRPFVVVATAYLVLNALYSTVLKHLVILDVLTIAIGFVLRAAAGAIAIQVSLSRWLFVCTILLALFIALAKRRHELILLADGAREHRPILDEYSPYLLDQLIGITAGSSLIAYILYTISQENTERFGTPWLDLTIPFPIYGIFRYLYLVHRRDGGGSPADLLLSDYPLLACVLGWIVAVIVIVYVRP
ncbi:MAG: decaprenyl-phosphate phosphoribosyltransferase [Vicinamibacterales bacterium]